MKITYKCINHQCIFNDYILNKCTNRLGYVNCFNRLISLNKKRVVTKIHVKL